jgi:TRAP-type C4-dicarboxylate transport system permease large subunit
LRALVAAAALGASAGTAQAQALKLAHITPPTHVWPQVSERFASELDKASGGTMKVTVSPLQKLGNEGQVTPLMQAGAVHFAVFNAAGLANREESLLGWSLAFQGVPDRVVETLKGLTSSPFVFVLLVIVMMLVLGMFLESISVPIVVVPLLMPVVKTLGIDPVHFGVVCTVIGLVTPPFGPGLYIAMMQADIRMAALFRATIPFLLMVLAVLVLIAAVPALSTWLPGMTL